MQQGRLDALIDPEYRGYRLGRRLYDARKELCRQLNFRAILAGGRIPNYHNHQDLTPGEYIEAVKRVRFMTQRCRSSYQMALLLNVF